MIIFNQNRYDIYNQSQLHELIKDVRKEVIANISDYNTLLNRIVLILNTKNEALIADKALDWEKYNLFIDVIPNQNSLVRALQILGYKVETNWNTDDIVAYNDYDKAINVVVDRNNYPLKNEINAHSRIVFSSELIKHGFTKFKGNEMYYI